MTKGAAAAVATSTKLAPGAAYVPADLHQVQACLRIVLTSRQRDASPPAAADGPAAAGSEPVPLSTAGRTASIKAAPAAADAAAPQQQEAQHVVQVKLTGLEGLEQELPAVSGATCHINSRQCCDVYRVALPPVQLCATEQLVRSWAAAAAQLQVAVSVLAAAPAAAAAKSKTPSAGASAAKSGAAAAAAPALASGSLTLNCAGLLVGDTAAACSWGMLQACALQCQEQQPCARAASGSAAHSTTPSVEAAAAGQDGAAAAAGGCSRFKWAAQAPSGDLEQWLGGVHITLQLFKLLPSEPPAADPKAAAKAAAAGKHAHQAPAEAPTAPAPHTPEPCTLLSPAAAAALNPLVLHAYKASNLPHAPARVQQLDTLCKGVKLRAAWPPLVPGAEHLAVEVTPWQLDQQSSSQDAGAVRHATFAAPLIVLGCDLGRSQLVQMCRTTPLMLCVHDRTALPAQPPFAALAAAQLQQQQQQQQQQLAAAASIKLGATGGRAGAARQTTTKGSARPAVSPAAAPAAAPVSPAGAADTAAAAAPPPPQLWAATAAASAATDEGGQVFGAAAVDLADLARGARHACFEVPLRPASTIRGVSCLDYKSRPGRYTEAGSALKGWVRCAVPLHEMATAAEGTASAATDGVAAVPLAAVTVVAVPASSPQPASAQAGKAAAGKAHQAMQPDSASVAAAPAADAAQKQGAQVPQRHIRAAAAAAAAAASEQPPAGHDQPVDQQQQQQRELEALPQPAAYYVALPPDARWPGSMTRAVFLLDYHDSDLLHVLEDSVRQHNAMALGLAPPPPPSADEVAAAAAAAAEAAAEAASAAAVAEAAAASAVTSSGGKGRRASSTQAGLVAAAAGRRVSVAGSAAGTARSALKQPQAAGAAAAAGPVGDGGSLASGAASSRQRGSGGQLQRHASFADGQDTHATAAGSKRGSKPACYRRRDSSGGESDSAASSDIDGDDDGALSAADGRLQAALQRYGHVELEQRLLQVLSTQQLSQEQVADEALDVITGFQLVDGALRLFVLEGPASGSGMGQLVPAIARWALEDQEEEETETARARSRSPDADQLWLPRRVLLNPLIKHPARLYGGLGVDVWMFKLVDRLETLGSRASTFTGHVRPECVAGMACLLGMTQGYVQPTHLQHAAPRAHPPAPAGGCTISSSKLEGQPCAALDATSSSPDARESSSNSSSKPGLLPSSGVVLMRQLESYRLFPSAQQLHLIDKRFGGELSKADVLGVEAEDSDLGSSNDEDEGAAATSTATAATKGPAAGKPGRKQQQAMEQGGSHAAAAAAKAATAKLAALLAEAGSAAAETAGGGGAERSVQSLRSRRSGARGGRSRRRSRHSRRGLGRSSSSSKRRRPFRPKHALDMDNAVYAHLRMEAHRRRVQRDIHAETLAALSALSATKAPLREAWAAWNPQRAAALDLQRQVDAGTLTLQATLDARREADSPKAPQGPPAAGCYPHAQPFMWPAPRDPQMYNQHALKPSGYRIEELQEPWDLPPAGGGHSNAGSSGGFDRLVRPSGGLFTQDPAFWQTVHLGGDGWEAQQAADAAAARAAWASKVVVSDPVFHGLPGTGDKAAAQADRLQNLLKGAPKKKGLQLSHVPPPPVSMHASTPWEPPQQAAAASSSGTAAGSLGTCAAERSKWIGPADFDATGNKTRSALARPGFSDAATAALHDADDAAAAKIPAGRG